MPHDVTGDELRAVPPGFGFTTPSRFTRPTQASVPVHKERRRRTRRYRHVTPRSSTTSSRTQGTGVRSAARTSTTQAPSSDSSSSSNLGSVLSSLSAAAHSLLTQAVTNATAPADPLTWDLMNDVPDEPPVESKEVPHHLRQQQQQQRSVPTKASKPELESEPESKCQPKPGPEPTPLEQARTQRAETRKLVRQQDETWRASTERLATMPRALFAMLTMVSTHATCRNTFRAHSVAIQTGELMANAGTLPNDDHTASRGMSPPGSPHATVTTLEDHPSPVFGRYNRAAFLAQIKRNPMCRLKCATSAGTVKIAFAELLQQSASQLRALGLSYNSLRDCTTVKPYLDEFQLSAIDWVTSLGASPSEAAELYQSA